MGQLPDIGENERDFELDAGDRLKTEWASIQDGNVEISKNIPKNVRDAINRSINSKTKSYRYVLPTHLLAKTVNPNLDCRAVQANAKMAGAFDARSLCQKVIVPFDRNTENVLGAAPEPYVNNPLRISAITRDARAIQRNKAGFDDLRTVLDFAQGNPSLVADLLRITLTEILRRLGKVRVVYPVPSRVSHLATMNCIIDFLKDRTGGARLQAIAVAFFRAIGELYGQYHAVRSNNINAADTSTGSAADLECLAADGKVIKAIEVKDRQLALLHVQVKLPSLREKEIREAVFVVQGGMKPADKDEILALMQKEFSSGQNLYVVDFLTFLDNHAVVFGESGRRTFLKLVGDELDACHADVSDRQRWRDLVAAI